MHQILYLNMLSRLNVSTCFNPQKHMLKTTKHHYRKKIYLKQPTATSRKRKENMEYLRYPKFSKHMQTLMFLPLCHGQIGQIPPYLLQVHLRAGVGLVGLARCIDAYTVGSDVYQDQPPKKLQ